jgi:hypothetical protein
MPSRLEGMKQWDRGSDDRLKKTFIFVKLFCRSLFLT